ncbi:MAG: site-2 protease family protein, partial [Sphingobacteriia bacterium]
MWDKATLRGGLRGFLEMMALISMVLALMNILPIPALDGGHLVFLLIEAVTGREPSLRVREVAQQIGMLLLLSLMAFVILNDFFK